MDPLSLVEEFAQVLIAALPTVADDIEQMLADFKARKAPELGNPPPAPEQKAIDSDIDKQIAALPS